MNWRNVRRGYLGVGIMFVVLGAGANPASEVVGLLDKLDSSYAKLDSAEFEGEIVGHFDVAGQQKSDDIHFTSSFRSPNQFRHDAKGDVLLGSTGVTAYALERGRNVYMSADAPKERAELSDWPVAIAGILQQQNPSMLLALTRSAGGELKELGQEMTRLPDTQIGGKGFPTIQFEIPRQHQVVTMVMDPQTFLLRQIRFDMRKSMEARGATDVKQAEVVVDYTRVVSNVAMGKDAFAWSPPAGATLAAAATSPADGDASDIAKALVGKAAPDFTLSGLDDKPVKLSSLKGSVVVLDFWATWCGPCVASLPHLDALYKEQSGRGLKVYAVNAMEEKETVAGFVAQKKLGLPVLLDVQGDVVKGYGADAIPETVVIGKDGMVKRVFVGVTDDSEEQLKAAVAKEMGE